jgi:hypothetical protein
LLLWRPFPFLLAGSGTVSPNGQVQTEKSNSFTSYRRYQRLTSSNATQT